MARRRRKRRQVSYETGHRKHYSNYEKVNSYYGLISDIISAPYEYGVFGRRQEAYDPTHRKDWYDRKRQLKKLKELQRTPGIKRKSCVRAKSARRHNYFKAIGSGKQINKIRRHHKRCK